MMLYIYLDDLLNSVAEAYIFTVTNFTFWRNLYVIDPTINDVYCMINIFNQRIGTNGKNF